MINIFRKNPFKGTFATTNYFQPYTIADKKFPGVYATKLYNLEQLRGYTISWNYNLKTKKKELAIGFIDRGFTDSCYIIKGSEAEAYAKKYKLPIPPISDDKDIYVEAPDGF